MKLSPRVKKVIALRKDCPLTMLVRFLNREERRQLELWSFQQLYPERFA